MHSGFMRDNEQVRDDNSSWILMKKRYMKKETEGLIMQSLRRRWLKYYIDRATDSRKPRMCGKMDENDFKYEILKMWKNEVTKVYIVPVVIGTLGMV